MLHGFGKPMHNADSKEILYQASLHNLHQFGCYPSRHTPEIQCCQGKFGPMLKASMMVDYTHDSKMLWRLWDPKFQKVKAQSEVVFDEQRNTQMLCHHGCNEIAIFGLPEDEKYVEETDTGDEPLRGQDSQPTQIGKRFTSHLHEAPEEEAENAHSWHLHREDQTTQRLPPDTENANSRCLHRED